MEKKTVDSKNIAKYPLSKLTKNWPFSTNLAEDFFSAGTTLGAGATGWETGVCGAGIGGI